MADLTSTGPSIQKPAAKLPLDISPLEAVLVAILTAIAVSLLQPPSTSLQPQWIYYLRIILSVYLLIELAFFIYGKIRYTVLNQPITKFPDAKRVQIAMERFLNLHSVFQLDEFLSGWFLGASPTSILRGNVEEFVAYGFFCQKVEDLNNEERLVVKNFLSTAEERWNMTFSPGKVDDGSLQYMAHVWEPLRVQHKPLILYAGTEFAAKVAHLLLRWMGFKKGRQGAFISWTTTMSINPVTSAGGSGAASGGGGGLNIKDSVGGKGGRRKVFINRNFEEENGAVSPTGRAAHNVKEAAHNAAEHALDAAVSVTSAAAASMAKQYPHEGQQYHLPPSRPRKIFASASSAAMAAAAMAGSKPIIRSIKEISSMMERRVGLPGSPPRKKPSKKILGALQRENDSSKDTEIKNQKQNFDGLPQELRVLPSTVPVVFLHGVGFGTLPYLHFIRTLMKACPQSPFILLEMPHVALRLCKEAESVDDVAAAAVAAVHKLGVKQACFVGHSYGTFCISRIVQLFPEAVHSTALLDPVCMLTCYPQLLFNFIYRKFVVRDLLSSVLAAVDGVRFLCSRDLTISQAFCRRFHWSELMLWPEDLPRERYRSLIVLSGKDDLVPGELVQIQFDVAEHPATVLYHPELGHGGLLLDSEWMAVVVEGVRRLVYRGEEEGEEEKEDAGKAD